MNTQGYLPTPGQGVYNPIRTWPLKTFDGQLNNKVSAKLFKAKKIRPYQSRIVAPHVAAHDSASYFAQYGRGPTEKQTAVNRLLIARRHS